MRTRECIQVCTDIDSLHNISISQLLEFLHILKNYENTVHGQVSGMWTRGSVQAVHKTKERTDICQCSNLCALEGDCNFWRYSDVMGHFNKCWVSISTFRECNSYGCSDSYRASNIINTVQIGKHTLTSMFASRTLYHDCTVELVCRMEAFVSQVLCSAK